MADGTVLFEAAPVVDAAQDPDVVIVVRDLADPGASAMGRFRLQRSPRLGLACLQSQLHSGERCTLHASRDGQAYEASAAHLTGLILTPQAYPCRDLEIPASCFHEDEAGRLTFTAPPVNRHSRCILKLSAHGHVAGLLILTLHPAPQEGSDASRPGLPSLRLLAGSLDPLGFHGAVAPLAQATALDEMEEPGGRRLWLVANALGLWALASGEEDPSPRRLLDGAVAALAVGPPGDIVPGGSNAVLFAAEALLPPLAEGPAGASDLRVPGFQVKTLRPDGAAEVLAGSAWHLRRDLPCKDGPAAQARFGFISGLAWGPGGSVFVADQGNARIRVIHPSGTVATLAGGSKGPARDGAGDQAVLLRPHGLAFDPLRHVLYVSDLSGVRQVTLDGRVTTLLPAHRLVDEAEASVALLTEPRLPWPERSAPVQPLGLRIHGDTLFIADGGGGVALWRYDLGTGALRPLVGSILGDLREGVLPAVAPGVQPAAWARLPRARTLAIDPGGILLVDLPQGVARVDLGRLEQPLGKDPSPKPPGAPLPEPGS